MAIVRTVFTAVLIAVVGVAAAHAQQWDTSKLQKNIQTPRSSAARPSTQYKAPRPSASPVEQAPAVTGTVQGPQWDASKLQPNAQTPIQGRFGTPGFQYVPPRMPVTPEKEAVPETIETEEIKTEETKTGEANE